MKHMCTRAGSAVLGRNAPAQGAYVPAVFDTQTMEMTYHEPVGGSNENVTIFYPRVCMDGDWLYTAIGNRPWQLHAYNFRTREYRLLATAPIIGDHRSIVMHLVKDGGVRGYIREADFIDGVGSVEGEQFDFWLKDGRIYQRTGDVPPWSEVAAEDGPPSEHIFRQWGNIQFWPRDWQPPSEPPYFDQDSETDTDGKVVHRFRWGNRGDWHEIALSVSSYPSASAMLTEVNENVIFAAAPFYSEHTFFDVQRRQYMGAGGSGISGYTCGVTNAYFSVCGYPNSITAYYDPQRLLDREGNDDNPVTIGGFARYSDTHYPTAGIVGGADGRIYSAGGGAGRTRRGGGWSWYDPATGELGGEQFEWNVTSIADVAQGRYILLSGGGMLSCWDTTTHSYLYQKALDGLDHPGYIVEALPGLVLGLTQQSVGEEKQDVLYGLDPVAGRVLWTRQVPAAWRSPQIPLYSNPPLYRRGPDGFVWTYFNDVLVRIDPRNAQVIPVGSLQRKAFIGFAGGNVYVGGQMGLHRIDGLPVEVLRQPTVAPPRP